MYRIALCSLLLLAVAPVATAQWTWSPQTGRWINLDRLPKETPELQIEEARTLLLDGDYGDAIEETNKFDRFYGDSELADENQFLRGEIRLEQGRFMDAAQEFQQVIANYPDTDNYDVAIRKQYEVGDRFYNRGLETVNDRWRFFLRKRPLRRAIDVYNMVIDNQPFTSAAAEAQYKVGLSNFAMGQYREAAFEYRQVLEDYSGSEWVDEAAFGLVEAYEAAALPPEYDQDPSRLTLRAIDSFRGRFPGDERNEQLDEIEVEMRERVAEQQIVVARFYEQRRLFRAARIYYENTVEQHPDTEAAETAQAWLDENPMSGLSLEAESALRRQEAQEVDDADPS